MRRLAPALLLLLTGAAAPPERNYLVAGFDRIRVDGPYEVTVTTGVPAGARAEGDQGALDRLTLRVDSGVLVVTASKTGWEANRGGPGRLRIAVSTPAALRSAQLVGNGRLAIDRMSGEVEIGVNGTGALGVGAIDARQLAGSLIGSGTLTVAGKARAASFNAFGGGTVAAGDLLADDLQVRAGGFGNGSYAARFTATITARGPGGVTVKGTPKCIVTGPGPVSCGDNVERR